MILAVETATSACSAAVLGPDGTLVAQRVAGDGPAHTQRLLPFVHEALEEVELGLEELDAVVCGLGPGAYTGMRIGVATARALAQASGLRLGGAPTLAAVALALAAHTRPGVGTCFATSDAVVARPDAPLVALLDGKRREVFAQVFRAAPALDEAEPGEAVGVATAEGAAPRGALEELAPLAVVAAADLPRFLGRWPGALIGGDGALLYAERLPAGATLVASAVPTAELVGRAWLAGVPGAVEGFDAVLPLYGRAPDAARRDAAAAPSTGAALTPPGSAA